MTRSSLDPRYFVLAGAVALGACTDPAPDAPDGEDPPAVTWGVCPAGFEAECARVPVPLDWDDPDGQEIELLVSRRPAPAQPARAQLVLVTGGPGNSGHHFAGDGTLDRLADVMPDTEVYVIEHRGVGYSTQLTCPEQQAGASPGGAAVTADEIPACAGYIDELYDGGLSGFSVSNAARDIRHVLSLAREDGKRQFVYGASYGTYLVQRFLRLFPDEIDGAILDSVVIPEQKFNTYDVQVDPVAMRMAARCAASPVCAEKLGADPWATIRDTIAALEQGHCADAGLTGAAVSSMLWTFLDPPELRDALFPLLYRLARCEPGDIAAAGHALAYLQESLSQTPAELQALETLLLGLHLAASEFVQRPFSADALLAACEEAIFCPDVSALMIPYFERWPTYDEPLVNAWPASATPVLAFNGDLDVKTTIESASRLADHLAGPHQNFYAFPDGPHYLLYTSTVKTPGAPTCALQMMADFIGDPAQPPDDGCLDDLVPFDPAGTPALAEQLFGTEDMWENPAGGAARATPAPLTADAWLRATSRLRRRSP
jgi:pimeloyl-ACP methyl ester carboxylesterase